MRVCIITPTFVPVFSGVTTRVCAILDHLEDAYVISLSRQGSPTYNGKRVYYVPGNTIPGTLGQSQPDVLLPTVTGLLSGTHSLD